MATSEQQRKSVGKNRRWVKFLTFPIIFLGLVAGYSIGSVLLLALSIGSWLVGTWFILEGSVSSGVACIALGVFILAVIFDHLP